MVGGSPWPYRRTVPDDGPTRCPHAIVWYVTLRLARCFWFDLRGSHQVLSVLLCRLIYALDIRVLKEIMLTPKSFQPRRMKRSRLERTMSLLLQRMLGQSTRETRGWRGSCGSGPSNNWPNVDTKSFEE